MVATTVEGAKDIVIFIHRSLHLIKTRSSLLLPPVLLWFLHFIYKHCHPGVQLLSWSCKARNFWYRHPDHSRSLLLIPNTSLFKIFLYVIDIISLFNIIVIVTINTTITTSSVNSSCSEVQILWSSCSSFA